MNIRKLTNISARYTIRCYTNIKVSTSWERFKNFVVICKHLYKLVASLIGIKNVNMPETSCNSELAERFVTFFQWRI